MMKSLWQQWQLRTLISRNALGISYPKSGRTWLRKMLADLGINVPFSHAGSNFLETGSQPDLPKLDDFISHSILLILRDPRDVLVSYHHDLVQRHRIYSGSLMDMARAPGIGIDSVCAFNMHWLAASYRFPRFHLLRYEDMHSDPERALVETCKFLGAFWITRTRIGDVVEASTFDAMRMGESSGLYKESYPAHWFEGGTDGGFPKVRRGRAAGFVDEMPEEVQRYCAMRMSVLGYPKEYLAAV